MDNIFTMNIIDSYIKQWTDEDSFKKMLAECGESILFHEYKARNVAVADLANYINRYNNFVARYHADPGFGDHERVKNSIIEIRTLIENINRTYPMNDAVLFTTAGINEIKRMTKVLYEIDDIYRRKSNISFVMNDGESINHVLDGTGASDELIYELNSKDLSESEIEKLERISELKSKIEEKREETGNRPEGENA